MPPERVTPRRHALQKRMNLTKTVRKLPITTDLQRKGYYTHDDKAPDIKYDTEEQQVRSRPRRAVRPVQAQSLRACTCHQCAASAGRLSFCVTCVSQARASAHECGFLMSSPTGDDE